MTYHVDSEFTEIGIQLTWESETSCNARHGGRDQMVQITIGWGSEFEGTKIEVSIFVKPEVVMTHRKQMS